MSEDTKTRSTERIPAFRKYDTESATEIGITPYDDDRPDKGRTLTSMYHPGGHTAEKLAEIMSKTLK